MMDVEAYKDRDAEMDIAAKSAIDREDWSEFQRIMRERENCRSAFFARMLAEGRIADTEGIRALIADNGMNV